MDNPAIRQYADVFLAHLQKDDSLCSFKNPQHCLKYVCSGELTLEENGATTKIHKGECVFIRRDHKVHIAKHSLGDEAYMGITMMFNREYLKQAYQEVAAKGHDISRAIECSRLSVIKLPSAPQFDGLFLSITPYLETSEEPSEEMMRLKTHEALLALTETDKRIIPMLFDFTEPWKIDLEEFMNANFMSDLTIKEFASYSGRSLATFKRDFKKISELTPEKWLIHKRLEKARELIENGHKGVSEACFAVGFRNRSHFTTLFKRMYGISPSALN